MLFTVATSIEQAAVGAPALLPPHVMLKISERIQSAEPKNAAFDAQGCAALAGKLEYADLRELQDAIAGKQTWPLFQPRFASKPMLDTRFKQLAELRNGIRHSRSVNEITRKEGEAAILWFAQVLAN